jgi:hypothetical protein
LETAEFGNGKSVACVSIGYGETGSQEFLDGGYWTGAREKTGPFIDPEPDVAAFKLFGTKTGGAGGLMKLAVIRAVMKAKKTPANLLPSGGFQWNLGGTFVVDLEKDELLFEHRQAGYADHPDIDTMLAACSKAVKQKGGGTGVPDPARGA